MIEVLKQALDALVVEQYAVKLFNLVPKPHITKAIASLNQAIAKLESQEPVALPCCGYRDASAVKWNPLNDVVQCHNCGQTYAHPPQRTEPPDWFPAVENILNEYGLQAIDFVADFKAAMKDAEQSQRTWVGLTDEEIGDEYVRFEVSKSGFNRFEYAVRAIEAKLKEKNNA